jgi:tRNA threonylcarbamoyl adenosine modification protein (Sua5/YciO/YrdC/YwlC family)
VGVKKAPQITINPRRFSRAAMASAADAILEGGVVAYPTETVYGLGANALDEGAVRRVFHIKGRSSDKPLIVLVRNRRELKFLVREVTASARALIARFWPDGLTLILEASSRVPAVVLGGGSSIAVRISGNRVVGALLDMVRVPLTASSANLAGHPAPITAQEVQEQLGNRVDLILNGGKTPLATPSTILDVRREPARLVRQGRVSVEAIGQVVAVEDTESSSPDRPAHILLVCTGNTCRSAMAEGLARKMFSARGLGSIRVRSAGTCAMGGQPAAPWAQEVAQEEAGIDLSGHRARQLTQENLREADLILAMALSHARYIAGMGQQFARKTYLLTSFSSSHGGDPEDIPDPLGGPRRAYQQAFRRIKRELERIVPALVGSPSGWHR